MKRNCVAIIAGAVGGLFLAAALMFILSENFDTRLVGF